MKDLAKIELQRKIADVLYEHYFWGKDAKLYWTVDEIDELHDYCGAMARAVMKLLEANPR